MYKRAIRDKIAKNTAMMAGSGPFLIIVIPPAGNYLSSMINTLSMMSPLARKALVWSNSSVKLQFALYMSRRFFDCKVISLQKIQNL